MPTISTTASTVSSDRLVCSRGGCRPHRRRRTSPFSSIVAQPVGQPRQGDPADVGNRRRLLLPAARGVGEQQLGQVQGDAGRQDVDRDTGDDVVDADRHRDQRVQQTAEQAADRAEEHARPRTPLVTGVPGAERAEDHHALDADVDHAGPFRPQAGQAGQRDRRGRDDRGLDRAGGVEVVRPGQTRTSETTASPSDDNAEPRSGRSLRPGPAGRRHAGLTTSESALMSSSPASPTLRRAPAHGPPLWRPGPIDNA